MVKAREYQEEKAAFKLAEEQAKYGRKVKRAANALRKKQEEEEKRKRKAEREAKAARQQLAKDLAIANKTLKEKPASTTPQVKRATPTAPNRRKVSTQPRVGACTTTPTVVAAETAGVGTLGVGASQALGQLICHNALDKKN